MKNPSPEQRKQWNKTYYSRHKAERIDQYRKHRRETAQWLQGIKSGLRCERCGFSHPAALDFHHRDPKQKVMGIAQMVNQDYSRETILAEIEKCEVICANCHRIEHYHGPKAQLDEQDTLNILDEGSSPSGVTEGQ